MRRRCSLCGGKLDGMICTECGLDNSKSDANYVTSQSHGGDEELTHVHSGEEDPLAGKTMTKEQRSRAEKALKARKSAGSAPKKSGYTPKPRKAFQGSDANERRNTRMIVILLSLFVVIVAAVTVGVIAVLLPGKRTPEPEYGSWQEEYIDDYDLEEYIHEPYDAEAYEQARSALAETGEAYEITLGPGYYKAGVHIPEGLYTMELMADDAAVADEREAEAILNLDDPEHGFYYSEIYTIRSPGERVRGNVELPVCRGALLLIENSVQVRFVTENAQLPLEYEENPNTQSGTFSKDFVVGLDIPAGTYDVKCEDGSGIFDYSTEDEDGYETYRGLLMSSRPESDFASLYQNVVLPKGTEVYLDGLTVSLTPSLYRDPLPYVRFYPE